MTHYNIAKKQEINPFDGVTTVLIEDFTYGSDVLKSFLDKVSESVETRKINDRWRIAYNINHLDFTTLVKWHAPLRGKFYFKAKSVEFRIEDDMMICW